ncbi:MULTISPECIES: helix-turn-helix transcriptional regulator [Cupriavidus]|uniref:Transcriptional regulator n=1 Tax=Cupriavidus pauculus TaxID=82633 RepID=A0A3G8HAP0_9BURK|nr:MULTISPECIES: PAS domain-containing protein [Cupriavidus]AZG16662.1 transcriptional regulator [Cupriavidus pauculus]MDT6961176.1 PAS domain-containing protein [Cupriavidus sp. SZY C1]
MPERTPEQRLLLEQVKQIADGLGQTLAPFCEVVLHDLLEPGQSILAIHNNLSGRAVGDPTTELGEARITDPGYPQILANYPNQFADGRQAKSTSIGIKDSTGRYVAALCMNVDLTLFRSLQMAMGQFVQTTAEGPEETLDPASTEALRARIDAFAARLATTPRALKIEDRRALLAELKAGGLLEVRRAMETIAAHLGVSRATVYTYAR